MVTKKCVCACFSKVGSPRSDLQGRISKVGSPRSELVSFYVKAGRGPATQSTLSLLSQMKCPLIFVLEGSRAA